MMNSVYRGSMAEHYCCADLLSKGFEVYKSVTHHGSVDLIIKNEENVLTVEVRRGKQIKPGSFHVSRRNLADVLAVVDHENNIYYFYGKDPKILIKDLNDTSIRSAN